MKSLVQITQQGKVKGLSASAAVSELLVGEIETRRALFRLLRCCPANLLGPVRKMLQGWSHSQ